MVQNMRFRSKKPSNFDVFEAFAHPSAREVLLAGPKRADFDSFQRIPRKSWFADGNEGFAHFPYGIFPMGFSLWEFPYGNFLGSGGQNP